MAAKKWIYEVKYTDGEEYTYTAPDGKLKSKKLLKRLQELLLSQKRLNNQLFKLNKSQLLLNNQPVIPLHNQHKIKNN